MGTRTLILLRHGQYEADAGGILTALGREQARVSGEYLANLRFDAVWSSTLPRARETAGIVAKEIAIDAERVRHVGVLREGMYTKIEGYEIPANERREDRARADAAYEKFFRKSRTDRTELLVCHGNLIRYLLCRALRTSVDKWIKMTSTHCGISRVLIRPSGAVRVVSYNEHSHLPPKLVT
ncbi:putative phosphoglycerate mutase [Labilithrix luteola]|uniref:Putative phosphoglycerate mutase n=1 Tax=Labilithrix luteola TaxID=1391654 RepID=A0A0K1QFW7_9BACT|nr:histidine phosphatase family protein [Labilithrix luteola]AKV04618.1 putative phosphoglycerate mutase [Labilithrix luteola]